MKITKIKIEGFKNSLIEATVTLNSEISILYGLNGSGKTTVLKIIHAVLSQKEDILNKENVKKVELSYTDASLFENTITIAYDNNEEKYDWSELENNSIQESKSLLIGVQRGVPITNNAISPRLVFDFLLHHNISREVFNVRGQDRSKLRFLADELSNFLSRNRRRDRREKEELLPEGNHVTMDHVSIDVIEQSLRAAYIRVKRRITNKIYNALFETFALAIDEEKITELEIPKNIIEIINANQERIVEALEDAPDNEFKNTVIHRIQNLSASSVEDFEKNKLFTKLLLQMVYELEQEKEELGNLNVLVEVFNSLLNEDKKLIIDREGVRVSVNKDEHELNELSSGERHLLTFLTTILLDGFYRDIILIDEPEISLNILWQEKLLDLIHQLAPKSQIIVASHSQSIAENHTNSLVEIIKARING